MSSTTLSQINPLINSLSPSATLAINERSVKLLAEGQTVYRLGFGQSPFPVPQILVKALEEHAHQKAYLPVQGLFALRQAIAQFNQRQLGIDCSAEQILIGPGSKALIYTLQLALKADLILPSPSWVSYAPQAHLLHKAIHWLPTEAKNGWRLDAEDLDRYCVQHQLRQQLLILNYPNNPVGNTYNSEQLEALAKVAQKHQLIVLADEIYGELYFGKTQDTIARYYPEGTIISSGLSKWCGAGGWRLGTFTFPHALDWILKAMITIASEMYSSVAAPIQYAAIKAFEESTEIDQYVHRCRLILRHLGHYFHRELTDCGLEMPLPEGGFYLFPNFANHRQKLASKGIVDSLQLVEQLLKDTGVALLPGQAFGRPANELTSRLSYVDFDGAAILSALKDVSETNINEAMVLHHCPHLKQAVQHIQKWVQD